MHVTTAGELRYPWLPPIADLCTQRQPALAYVASVSSRVMREIWSGSISLLSFQFSRRTRVEPLATQANQPWWSYIFQNTWQLTRVYNEKMMWYRAIADLFLVILGDFGCDFDHLSMRSRSVPSSFAHSNSASSPRTRSSKRGGFKVGFNWICRAYPRWDLRPDQNIGSATVLLLLVIITFLAQLFKSWIGHPSDKWPCIRCIACISTNWKPGVLNGNEVALS